MLTGDDYSELYREWAERYRAAVLESAEGVLMSVDTDLDEDLEEDTQVLSERLESELNDRSGEYWFEPMMSQEHAAFICLTNSGTPSVEPFNHGIKPNTMVAEFPFADCAAAAFEEDVRNCLSSLLGYDSAGGAWSNFDWKREIENYCAAAKADRKEETGG
ncbi:MAG: hypothetical protein B7Z37_28915 [Verrucomicrobia bacterium 12-59-8]|nr:MAG: hypothetical protein B7Z37_28915 [Verrucomicrobia bacterium 12-59-8]